RHLLDRGRRRQGRRHRVAGAALPAPPPRLPHRQGERGIRRHADGQGSGDALGRSRDGRRGGERDSAARRGCGGGRAAVAGRRLFRPIRQFRGTRRRLPPPRRAIAGSAAMSFARTDQSAVAQWWWTVDRWTLVALAVLIGLGSLLVMAASPAVAERIHAGGPNHIDSLHFVKRYFAVLPVALATMFAVSLQSPRMIRRIA